MEYDLPLLQVKNVSKQYALESGYFSRNKNTVFAVNDVSFDVKKGETYGIVGESGCGKTTTARLIIQMEKQTSGDIFFAGENIATYDKKDLKLYREKVKYIFQDPARSLNPRMTIFDILTKALRYSSQYKSREESFERAKKIISEVGLSENDLEKKPNEFSGGQRQRISIARGLIMNPSLLICDEVVSALDVSIQGQIINLLHDIKSERNLSYVFITHDLKVACYFSDKIGVMYRGIMVEEADAADLYKTALHPYTKLLFEGSSFKETASSKEVQTTLKQETACPFFDRCPYAKNECETTLPKFREVEKGHKVRCVN